MYKSQIHSIRGLRSSLKHSVKGSLRSVMNAAEPPRKEGDISSVFVSLSGVKQEALPERFADQKRRLIAGNEKQVKDSWDRLLRNLREEVRTIRELGSNVIPSIDFKDIKNAPESFQQELRKRGVAVVRGVVPEAEARSYKESIEDYVRANPHTRGKQAYERVISWTSGIDIAHSFPT